MTTGMPSRGFVFLILAIGGIAGFFVWGARHPALEVAWELEVELRAGERGPLSAKEFKLLDGALRDHKMLSSWFLDGAADGLISTNRDGLVDTGYAYWIRSTSEPRSLVLESQDPQHAQEIIVHIKTEMASHLRRGPSDRALRIDLPVARNSPQLVELRFRSKSRGKSEKRLRGVQIRWADTSSVSGGQS